MSETAIGSKLKIDFGSNKERIKPKRFLLSRHDLSKITPQNKTLGLKTLKGPLFLGQSVIFINSIKRNKPLSILPLQVLGITKTNSLCIDPKSILKSRLPLWSSTLRYNTVHNLQNYYNF